MKIVNYQCNQCGRRRDNADSWIEIGSNAKFSLFINNPIKNSHHSNHQDVHLCSEECVIKFFIGNNKQQSLNKEA